MSARTSLSSAYSGREAASREGATNLVKSHIPSDSLDEPIHLSDWNSAWPRRAKALIAELTTVLGAGVRIEHFGSTSVEGVKAKPVIDLMIGTREADEVDVIAAALVKNGFTDLGEAGVQGRRALRLRSEDDINIAIVRLGGEHWINNIAIRDYLRSHPAERARYSALKEEIVQSGADRLLAYSDRKAAFMAAMLADAIASTRPER
jgi:GrpB-like predicted nucleotidyltransferase (UPF0157 family)